MNALDKRPYDRPSTGQTNGRTDGRTDSVFVCACIGQIGSKAAKLAR